VCFFSFFFEAVRSTYKYIINRPKKKRKKKETSREEEEEKREKAV
jgi:hypothetical protein